LKYLGFVLIQKAEKMIRVTNVIIFLKVLMHESIFYERQPWVAHRTFTPSGDDPRTVLSNDKDHEFLRLDGNASLAWKLIAEDGVGNPNDVAKKLGVTVSEVQVLLDDLLNANLLKIKGVEDQYPSEVELSSSNLPSSERYHAGGYTEPSPGGSNLEAEFEFQDWALSHGFLWSALWEITFRCNEACVHCFNPGASHSEGQRAYRKTEELERDEWLKLLDEFKSLGVFRLLLTGGEVALRKDFFEILEACSQRGFSVTVFTNGTLFDADEIIRLANFYPHRIELSLYSPEPAVHDRITRLKGSFEKTRNSAFQLKQLGVTVAIKMSVMAETINSVLAFRALCDEWGIEPQVDYNMSPGVDGAREPLLELLPAPLELIRAAMTPGMPLFAGVAGAPNKSDWVERKVNPICGAGRTTMSISPEGHIYPCNSLPIHVGSTRTEGLSAVWKNSVSGGASTTEPKSELSQWQSIKGADYRVCGSFDRCEWCHKCPGMALLESGDELGPSTTNCRNSAARMIAFDLIEKGRTPESISSSDLEPLQLMYAENTPLWEPNFSVESKISLESLKKSLKSRTKATALERDPLLG
jgi:radical SAM protein with 4Fe4S-binding SPASM domain